ncbi:MAG: sugar kinase [Bacilli bacterium]|nr:sugar kinase [Bacilli bacterium]MBN2876212.1 sugar kinase [Bacilli bacterium]
MIWDKDIKIPTKEIDVLLVGEIVIDIIQHESSHEARTFIGGSPYNICKNLTKLGIQNKFYGSVGNDDYGTQVLEQIKQKGIDAEVNITDGPTSYVFLNQTVSSPIPIFHRSADYYIYLDDKLITDASHSKILHFTYWPLSKGPARDTLLDLIDKAKANSTLIGFDPNYHPHLDDESQSGLQLIKDVIHKVDFLKPSRDDSERMFGKHSTQEYLEIYESLGAKLVIMTLGKDGLAARYEGQTIQMPTYATEVVDSTGAGDAFWSGFYSGLIHHLSLHDALKLGSMCSSMKLKTVGAEFDVQKYEDLIKTMGW